MFRRILAATDFSAASDAALVEARRLARDLDAGLHVLHVIDNMFMRVVLADPRDYETAALRQLQDRLPAGDRATLAVARSDEPADAITRYARVHDIDLIVMGTQGRGRMAHLLLGSVAAKVARTAPCPVLTMREAPPVASGPGLRILVPTDFSAPADAALGCAKRLAARSGGSVCLLHVMEHTAVGAGLGTELVPEPPQMAAERSAKAKVEIARRTLADSRSRVKIEGEVVQGAVAATIGAYAGDYDFDLIVMGTHGRKGLTHLLMGSVAESVIRTATRPVLTVKERRSNPRDGSAEPLPVAV